MRSFLPACLLLTVSVVAWADGPADNHAENVRPVPPIGMELKAEDRAQLEEGLKKLEAAIAALAKRKDARTPALLPDVEIFARAVRQGLDHRELFSQRDVDNAKKVLQEGLTRAEALQAGQAPWTTQTGLVVRGFRSRIDRTVQPYGLVIPESYTTHGPHKFRLDLWFHGRGEVTSEVPFISERMSQKGRIVPADTIVLHPYGRYSNAFKFAGEIDVLEALEHAQQNYRVDEDRIAVRGFSMGGAGCWQMAVHYPSHFFAANPGAGFSETKQFLETFQGEVVNPTPYEEKLWRMYDCPGYASNLFNLPTVAYSGELDKQKQAADVMTWALLLEGMNLTHIIGPETKHDIHPASAKIIDEKLALLAKQGRDALPMEIRFATFTLKYNRSHWLTVNKLEEHWEDSRVIAKLVPAENTIRLATKNVRELSLALPAGSCPFALDQQVKVAFVIDGSESEVETIQGDLPGTDRSWTGTYHFDGRKWHAGPAASTSELVKQHNLQGPIDDAFMDSFIIVKPTGKARQELVDQWTNSEMEHLIREWRRQFRGDAVVKRDDELTAEDIAQNHLIVFGDAASNKFLASIADKLPIQWSADQVVVGDQKFPAADHAPVFIYPNPANPQRYVVLNSGFTYREFAYLNNARQVPKLPDWAVIDLKTPADSLWPGKVVAADFFDEQWQLK